MSGQQEEGLATYTEAAYKQDLARMDGLVTIVANSQRNIEQLAAEYEQRIAPFKELLAREVDPFSTARDASLDELAVLMARVMSSPYLSGKSVSLRAGTISVRTATSIEVHDESLLMKLARRLRILRLVSEQPRRKIVKSKIAKLLKERPDLVDKLSEAVGERENSRMTVKLPETQAELVRDVHPLRTTMPL